MKKTPNKKKEEKPMDFLDSFNAKETKENNEISKNDPQIDNENKIYKVRVTHPSLRIRRAPSLQAEIVDFITDKGEYIILDEVNGWGKIDENKWIMLSYTQII